MGSWFLVERIVRVKEKKVVTFRSFKEMDAWQFDILVALVDETNRMIAGLISFLKQSDIKE